MRSVYLLNELKSGETERICIHDATTDRGSKITGTLTQEIGAIDALEFNIYPGNAGYKKITPYVTRVDVIDDDTGKSIFYGRVLRSYPEFSASGIGKKVVCEGIAGFLHDEPVPLAVVNDTVPNIIRGLFEKYNELHKYDVWLFNDTELDDSYRTDIKELYQEGESMYDFITTKVFGTAMDNAQWYITTGANDTNEYYRWCVLNIYGKAETHLDAITIGDNLIAYSADEDASNLCTQIIPLGAKIYTDEDNLERIDITSVNAGNNTLVGSTVSQYGRITKTVLFDDVDDPEELLKQGEAYLEQYENPQKTYQITALDMHLLDKSVPAIVLGDWYEVDAPIIGVDKLLLRITKRALSIENPANDTFTVGDAHSLQSATASGQAAATTASVQTVANYMYSLEKFSAKEIHALHGSFTELEAKAITVDTLEAAVANISSLTAEDAIIKNIQAQALSADHIKAVMADIEALTVDTADARYLTADRADIRYADITLANVKNGAIGTALIAEGAIGTTQIKDGSITSAKIVELTANKITAGTLSVERLCITGSDQSIIYAINNSGTLISQNVDTIDGNVLTKRSITADCIVAGAITAKELAASCIITNHLTANAVTAAKIDVADLVASDAFISNLGANRIIVGLQTDVTAAKTTADSASTTASAAKTTADSASTTASEAKTTADSASTTASEAKTTANSASTTASAAKTTANSASTTANTAKTNAASALSTANSALSGLKSLYTANTTTIDGGKITTGTIKAAQIDVADLVASDAFISNLGANRIIVGLQTDVTAAKTTADSASTTASAAKTTADSASTTASEAKTTADSASTTASEAKTTANSASTTASAAKTTANSASTTANTAKTNAASALSTANSALSGLKSLYTANTTTIDGGKITTGTIKAAQIDVSDLFAQKITATGSISGVTITTNAGTIAGWTLSSSGFRKTLTSINDTTHSGIFLSPTNGLRLNNVTNGGVFVQCTANSRVNTCTLRGNYLDFSNATNSGDKAIVGAYSSSAPSFVLTNANNEIATEIKGTTASFGGTLTVASHIYTANGVGIYTKDTAGVYRLMLKYDGSHNLLLGYGAREKKAGATIVYGNVVRLHSVRDATYGSDATNGHFYPTVTGKHRLGSSNYKWQYVYATNGTIQTSDLRHKDNVQPISERYEDLYMRLRPVTYRWRNEEVGDHHDRTRMGFIAQWTKEAMDASGLSDIDLAAYCKDPVYRTVQNADGSVMEDQSGAPIDYSYGLNYGEFIALNTHMVQKLYRKMNDMRNENIILRGKLMYLESMQQQLQKNIAEMKQSLSA